MSVVDGVERARFIPRAGQGGPIDVHFNPVSLRHEITNTLEQQSQDQAQFVKTSTAKLSMDLVFDTTHSGEDVRSYTNRLAKLMEPELVDGKRIPSVVQFEWGVYTFSGMVESYKETIDFFAANGVPLRAGVSLTLVKQSAVFEDAATSSARTGAQSEPFDMPPGDQTSAAGAARQAGSPGAMRAVGRSNNQESLRFSSGPLTVPTSITLSPPTAFASGSAGFGASASAGFGASASAGFGASASAGFGASASAGFGASASAGFGASASAGFGASASAGFGASASAGFGASASAGFGASASAGLSAGPAIGGSASAGVSASQGAFAGLNVSSSASVQPVALQVDLLRPQAGTLHLEAGQSGGFRLGGRARVEEATGLQADVGVNADLHARLRFEEG